MGRLTEGEIFACLAENFKLAAEHCEDLARLPAKGLIYAKLREELKLIEGAARQAGQFRDDARWFQIGLMMGEAHKRAGTWLRGHYPAVLFTKLADNLRKGEALAESYRTSRTHRVGMILPKPLPAPIRTQGRSVQVRLPERVSPGGIILP